MIFSFIGNEKKRKLEELVKAEETHNKKVIQDHKGVAIVFGSELAFRHLDSDYYLSGEKDSSTSRNTGYKCKLKKEFGKSSVFELTSFFKSKKAGDIINTNNSVLVKNINNNCYLNFDSDRIIHMHYQPGKAPEDVLRPDVQHTDQFCSLHASFYSNEAGKGWSFDRLVGTEAPIKNLKAGSPIRGLDLIYLNHPELKADLCSDAIYSGSTHPVVYFRKYTGSNPHEQNSINSVWQIEHLTTENQGGMFESIENNEEVVTSKLTTNPFRLRHLVTGRLMAIRCYDRDNVGDNDVILKSITQPQEPSDLPSDIEEDPDAISIGGMGQENEENEGGGANVESISTKLNFEFVIMEEKFLRNKCLVYLQTSGME